MPDVAWIHYARPRTRWYALPPPEQAPLRERFAESRTRSVEAGGRFLGTFHARGQGDFSTVELWRFPDMEAAFEHWARMTDSGYAQWFAFTNTVGQSLKEAP